MVDLQIGDNMEVMATMADNSVDAVVTDPPYALTSGKNAKSGFMGKEWDSQVPSVATWKEVLRILKPGGHLLAFGGTRTYHRAVVNIEDAGFEIKDQIQWIFASGFPKSQNVSKVMLNKIEEQLRAQGVNDEIEWK
jgi:DNA modification methylase